MTAHANFTEELPVETKSTQEVSNDVARFFSTPEMLVEVSGLAKRAEWWGAPPQGRNVALFAECLVDGDLLGAMETRDEILAEVNNAKSDRCSAVLGVAGWGLGVAFFAAFVTATYVLILDPLVIGLHKAASIGVDALEKRF